jgi:hypothetical protein
MMSPYDGDERRKSATDDHIKLMIAEITTSLLKDQKLHITTYVDKRIAATEEKFTDRHGMLIERLKKTEVHCEDHGQSLHRIDRKVEMWVNRGVGVWALAITLFVLIEFGLKFMKGTP